MSGTDSGLQQLFQVRQSPEGTDGRYMYMYVSKQQPFVPGRENGS